MMKNSDIFLKSVSEGLKALAKGIEEVAAGLENFQQQDVDEKEAPETPPETEKPRSATAGSAAAKSGTRAKKRTAAPKTAGKRKTSRKKAPKVSSTAAVMKELKKAPEGLDPSTLAQNTGFTVRTIHNAVSKLKEEGKIQSVKRGVYTTS